MAFTPLTVAEIASGKPMTTGLLAKIKACLDYLYGIIGSTGAVGVPNGSFEIDSDGDGNPDSWTKGLYAGGSGTLYTTSPAHGAKSWSFTHPGGAGNGGGYLDSDYLEVSELLTYDIQMIHWATAAGMKNKVQVRYFDKDKTELGAGSPTDVYSSTANPTTPQSFKTVLLFTPPATTRFVKIRLIGGYTDTNVAGTAYFDDVDIKRRDIYVPGATIVWRYDGPVVLNGTSTILVFRRRAIRPGTMTVAFTIAATGVSQQTSAQIYVNGVARGTLRSVTNTSATYSESITFVAGDVMQIYAGRNGEDDLSNISDIQVKGYYYYEESDTVLQSGV